MRRTDARLDWLLDKLCRERSTEGRRELGEPVPGLLDDLTFGRRGESTDDDEMDRGTPCPLLAALAGLPPLDTGRSDRIRLLSECAEPDVDDPPIDGVRPTSGREASDEDRESGPRGISVGGGDWSISCTASTCTDAMPPHSPRSSTTARP